MVAPAATEALPPDPAPASTSPQEHTRAQKPTRTLSPRAARVVHWMLHDIGGCSARQAARTFDKDYRWIQRATIVAASVSTDVAQEKWNSLLTHLETLQREGGVRCLRFSWCLMSDETPTRKRVTTTSAEGDQAHDSILAKVMGCKVFFSVRSTEIDGAGGDGGPAGDGIELPCSIGIAHTYGRQVLHCARLHIVNFTPHGKPAIWCRATSSERDPHARRGPHHSAFP